MQLTQKTWLFSDELSVFANKLFMYLYMTLELHINSQQYNEWVKIIIFYFMQNH